ncbi:alpha/beta hydrolase [Herminiimonas sp. KBW02]|uniref:alpha/beta fold hydrolase n=1 Tax=Herminiimonas sp. KBW02 TaxID=2153363 RepID=UPI000F5B065C|nr:alpha/beta hydrolase [Herminiimonas sp. KBW02]RQO33431.1 alpha/beta hydrolase [Herminiimonas sp. KBW02]
MKSSYSEWITIRGLQYHIRHWGEPDAPVLFMLHGWMDVSASFQFLVDSLQGEWHVIAPDWRGFGLTDHAAGNYWFPDYLADLDAILQHYSPEHAVNLLGHSLGANVAGIYAGVRSQRVKRLVLLEGFGMPATQAQDAPARFTNWLDELREPPLLRNYGSSAEVARRLQKNNPRLNNERAAFLSVHWAVPDKDGRWELQADPAHRLSNPYLYRIEEVLACWRAITAPVLWVEGKQSELLARFGTDPRAVIAERIACIADAQVVLLDDAGHMLQHDQPEKLAAAMEQFLA